MSFRSLFPMLGRRAAPVLALLASATAFTVLVVETRAYFIDVPFWDEWLLPPLIALRDRGELGLSQLMVPHNEHIPFFPRLVLLALAGLTNWDLWYECVANLVLGLVSLMPLLLWLRRDARLDGAWRQALYATVAIVVLSLNQWENWMWGWQVEVFLCTAALTWGIFALTSMRGVGSVVIASICGVVASFSFASGLLFWPATLPAAWGRWKRRPLIFAGWLAVGVATMAWYAHAIMPQISASGGIRPPTPGVLLTTASRVLGTSLTGSASAGSAELVGVIGVLAAVGLGVAAYRTRTASDVEAWPWWTLLLFGLASMVMIAYGRTLSPGGPIPSRYLTFANFAWTALAVLFVRLDRRLLIASLLVPVLTTITAVQGRQEYVSRRQSLHVARTALYQPIDNPLLRRLFWREDFVLEQLPMLQRLHLSVFDCARQISKEDWDQAAIKIARYGRSGDVAVTSSDWGARCLGERLQAGTSGVRVVSSGERQANVEAALAGKGSAFLVTGGDLVSLEARTWIERHGFPLYRSPIGSLRLLYFPDRVSFVRDRLRAEDVAADRPMFERHRNLIAAEDDQFFPWGWEHPQTDARGGFRSIVTREAFLYVPVVREAPRTLRIDCRDAPILLSARGDVTVTIAINDVQVFERKLARDDLAWQVDLSSAAWRYGANVVRISLTGGHDTEPAPAFTPLLNVRQLTFESASN
jgi:hypothetical protein